MKWQLQIAKAEEAAEARISEPFTSDPSKRTGLDVFLPIIGIGVDLQAAIGVRQPEQAPPLFEEHSID